MLSLVKSCEEYLKNTCEEYLALPPLLPPEVIALLLPWLPVDRPEDRQDELNEQFGHSLQLSHFNPPAGAEHPWKLHATPHQLASPPMGTSAVAMVMPAQQCV